MDQATLSPAVCPDTAPEPSLYIDTKTQPGGASKNTQDEELSTQVRASVTEEETILSPAEVKVIAVQPRTFHLFPELPAEIQHMIFREALPGPRLVEAKIQFGDRQLCSCEMSCRVCFCKSRTPPPVLLHACRTSRLEALKRLKPYSIPGPQQPVIYFDFTVDTLFMACSGLLDFFFGRSLFHSNLIPAPLLQSLKHLMIPWCMRKSYIDWGRLYLIKNIKYFQSLETVTLVKHGKTQCRNGWVGVGLRPFMNSEDLAVDFGECAREMDLDLKNWSDKKVTNAEVHENVWAWGGGNMAAVKTDLHDPHTGSGLMVQYDKYLWQLSQIPTETDGQTLNFSDSTINSWVFTVVKTSSN